MNSSICANCLLRLRASSKIRLPTPPISLTATQSFHTTPFQFDVVKKKSGPIQQKKFRESTSVKIKKKGRRERPKPPDVGERKALRKRIVLSNTNALEIPGMEDMTPENMADEGRIGQVLGLEGALLDQLREAKAFKPTQNWNMFRRPATLIRKQTVALTHSIQEVNDGLGSEGLGALTLKRIIAGERSTGKSLLLLQAMSMAYMNNWIVLNVPEGMASSLTTFLAMILTLNFSPRFHNRTILLRSFTRIRNIRTRATVYPAKDDLRPPFPRCSLE
jgi:small subunit ribosomal protein S29